MAKRSSPLGRDAALLWETVTKLGSPTELVGRVVIRAAEAADLATLQAEAVRVAERVIPRKSEDQYYRDLAAVERAIQAPRRGSPRRNAILIGEVLRYWHKGDRGAAFAKRAQNTARPVWERHRRLQLAAEELLDGLGQVPGPSADEQQLREALTRCERTWARYVSRYTRDFDLGPKASGRPRSQTLTYEGARRLLMLAGLGKALAERLLAGRG